MTTIQSGSCHAEIGRGLLAALGGKLAASRTEKSFRCAVVTDRNVEKFHLATLLASLEKAKIESIPFVVEPGENSKSFATLERLVAFLAAHHFTRSDAVIALGGGVVGDLAGFAASTFLRGVRLFQAPTTLLAMIDSSVGGKTAVNLPEGKNLCGTFYPAEKIFIDVSALATLPEKIFADGAAEAVKYGMICDARLFDGIGNGALVSDAEKTISRCVEIKAQIVARDLYDRGERRLLNFGHTLGHAIEIASDFSVSHGCAVAIGMAEITRAACRRKLCRADVVEKLLSTLKKLHLPTENDFDAATLQKIMLNDKKRHGSTLELVIPREVGSAELYPLEIGELQKFLA